LNELAQYLFEKLLFDFNVEVTAETVRAFLRRDENAESRALLQKIIEENGIDDLLMALADCLTVDLPSGINANVIRKHLSTYAES
jgi:hypothetical protein